jgi:AraC-like DNA-binding protein
MTHPFVNMDRHLGAPRMPDETGRLALSTRTRRISRMPDAHGRLIARQSAPGHDIAGMLVRPMNQSLQHLLDEGEATVARLEAVKPSTRRALFQRLERARNHLHDNQGRAVTLAELATVAGLSQFHLARYFKLAFGTPPIAYHRALRLKRAAKLLVSHNHTLIEVAELTGYSDEVALSHAFRRHYGKPPQLWAMQRRVTATC